MPSSFFVAAVSVQPCQKTGTKQLTKITARCRTPEGTLKPIH